MKKKLIALLLCFVAVLSYSSSMEDQIQESSFDWVQKMPGGEKNRMNWASLFYSAFFSRKISIEKSDNFIQKSLFEKGELVTAARKVILEELLTINIDHEITVKELLEISEIFQKSLTRKFFSPEILLPVAQAGYQLNMGAAVSFTGEGNLIDLILKSGYFVDREPLTPAKSLYRPYAYTRLIIEARHLDLKPALFPKIYVQDPKGNLFLVYSLAHASLPQITEQGYARYYTDTKSFDLKKVQNYYCPALKLSGTKNTDVVISYEDYIKFFASAVSYQNLSQGNLAFIASPLK